MTDEQKALKAGFDLAIADDEIEQQVIKEGTHNWDCQCGVHLWNEEKD